MSQPLRGKLLRQAQGKPFRQAQGKPFGKLRASKVWDCGVEKNFQKSGGKKQNQAKDL
jgi:hypothetical protein